MISGLVFFSWSTKWGATLEMVYPLDLSISEDLLNKIYMTHYYELDYNKEELVEITYKNQIILSFCDKSRVSKVGYELVVIILDEKEKVNLYKIKSKFLDFAKKFIREPKEKRNDFFQEKIYEFFDETSTKKVLLVGRAGTGKTSIKKIVFEGYNYKELLDNPLEPTRGISPSVYSWLDLKLGVFDTSGQELSFLLENELDDDHFLAFENTDIILYLFDYPLWTTDSQLILKDIQRLSEIIKQKSYNIKIISFIHKIDLIEKENRKKVLGDITNSLKNQFKISIYYTSIYPALVYNLYNAFYELLSKFSKENILMKKILDDLLIDYSKTMFFLTNQNDGIIVQSMSKDFNTLIINHSHKLIAQLNKTFEDMANNDRIEHLILSGSNNLNIIMNNLNYQRYNLKNLICLSESLSANKLIWIVGQIRLKLKNLYYFEKELLH